MLKNEEEDKGSYTEHDAKTEKEASYDKYDDSIETEDKKEEKQQGNLMMRTMKMLYFYSLINLQEKNSYTIHLATSRYSGYD